LLLNNFLGELFCNFLNGLELSIKFRIFNTPTEYFQKRWPFLVLWERLKDNRAKKNSSKPRKKRFLLRFLELNFATIRG
jgi:hypothetical protein